MTRCGTTYRQIFQAGHPREVYVGEEERLEAGETAEQSIWQGFPHVAVSIVGDPAKFFQAQEKLLREPSYSIEVAGVKEPYGRHVPQQLLRERGERVALDKDSFDGACSREAKGVVVQAVDAASLDVAVAQNKGCGVRGAGIGLGGQGAHGRATHTTSSVHA